jgi:hypothetical protein
LGIPHCLNVISNLPFALVGLIGLTGLMSLAGSRIGPVSLIDRRERWSYLVFFVGVGLTSVGSAYYHLAPGNERLVWDRLPMTLAFMSLFAAIISERVDVGLGLRTLTPLLILGAASVYYWRVTEMHGAGDLRVYGLVQFYPLLAIPLLLWAFQSRYTGAGYLGAALSFYVVAKIFELLDGVIYSQLVLMSGHTLKHLAAALAAYLILLGLKRRSPHGAPEAHQSLAT